MLHFIDIRKNSRTILLYRRDNHDDRCGACKQTFWKHKFYLWFSVVQRLYLGYICSKCSKRQWGMKALEVSSPYTDMDKEGWYYKLWNKKKVVL